MTLQKIICKICGSLGIEQYFKNDDRILKCKNCEVVFQSPKILYNYPDGLEKYYSERFISPKYTSENRIKFLKKNSAEILKILNKYIGNPKGLKLLDIGANIGVFVNEAIKRGYEAVGIEPSKNLVSYAEGIGIPIFESTVEKFNPRGDFEIITMFHVLEHLSSPIGVLKKLNSIHKKKGFLIIEVPNIKSYMAKKDGISWKFIAYEHIFYFSPKTISDILKNLGYKIMLVKKRNFELKYLNIRKLAEYLWGRPSNRNRFIKKVELPDDPFKFSQGSLFKRIVKKLILLAIKILGRKDHILIIAQKT